MDGLQTSPFPRALSTSKKLKGKQKTICVKYTFSFASKTIFFIPKPKEEIIKQDSIEDILRKKLSLENDDSINLIFILAIMLERKKILIEKSVSYNEKNNKIRVYEHKKTKESFIIIDPELSLS